ncbi:efflux RND transporter periplasmic adaptor subunit [Actinoplanes sp. NPDC089786]|uniref:efflux RND transporter periplasmic adaptor subunit n=1 Tax=Actinoplanes sp. NPDC089786 TaxID=3155185 RepID=UPI0034234905
MSHRRGRRLIVAAATATVLVASAAVVVGWRGRHHSSSGPVAVVAAATTKVTKADLSTSVGQHGTVGYAAPHVVKDLSDGRVTGLPPVGATIGRGQQLLRVGDRPVILLYGSTPLFRSLDQVGLVGADVKVLRDNLSALGYRTGHQPEVGTTLHPPAGDPATSADGSADAIDQGSKDAAGSKGSGQGGPPAKSSDASGSRGGPGAAVVLRKGAAELTLALVQAVKRWQLDVGLPATGTVGPADVVVEPRKVRVAAVTARVGDPASGSLLTLASTERVINVSMDPAAAAGVKAGQKVNLTTSDSRSARGTVRTVTQPPPPEDGADQGSDAKVTVTVTADDPNAVKAADGSSIQVGFTAEVRKGVLTVPVGALLALHEGGYCLQLPDGRLIAVRTGLFAGGDVEVSGAGVREGMTVVTAS